VRGDDQYGGLLYFLVSLTKHVTVPYSFGSGTVPCFRT